MGNTGDLTWCIWRNKSLAMVLPEPVTEDNRTELILENWKPGPTGLASQDDAIITCQSELHNWKVVTVDYLID